MSPSDQTWLPHLTEWTEYELGRMHRDLAKIYDWNRVEKRVIGQDFKLRYHLFLSHCWKFSQDQVNTLRKLKNTNSVQVASPWQYEQQNHHQRHQKQQNRHQ